MLETCPHSIDILIVVVIITLLIVLVRGILLRFPLTPRFGPSLLKRLPGDVFIFSFFSASRVVLCFWAERCLTSRLLTVLNYQINKEKDPNEINIET